MSALRKPELVSFDRQVGLWLKNRRIQANLSLAEMQNRLGWSHEKIVEIEEHGKISRLDLEKLAEIYQLDFDEVTAQVLRLYLNSLLH